MPFSGTPLATTVRVINWVHRHPANGWTNALPSNRPCLAVLTQAVLFVGDLANRGATVNVDPPHFSRTQANLSVRTLPGEQGACCPG